MRSALLFFALFIGVIFSSCRSGRTITKAIAPRDTTAIIPVTGSSDSVRQVEAVRTDLRNQQIDFRTFSAKIKMDIEDSKGKKPDVTANVRILKDSVIWISLTATILNIEVFRAYITKDSVILLNKQDKEVQYRSLDYLQEIAKIPLDFKTLQDIFIGNPVFIDEKNISVKNFGDIIQVTSISNRFKNLLTISNSDKLLQRSKLDDLDPAMNRTADFTYTDYERSNNILFATGRRIIVSEKNRIDISMNFKQFEFNKELSLPFSVPKNYTRN